MMIKIIIRMEGMQRKAHSYYIENYMKKLQEQDSVVQALSTLCAGSLQTFKQVTNKLSKNKSSPLPLFFPSVESMETISKNRPLLRSVFKVFDTRALGRIDGCELYAACLTLSKGSHETYLKTVVDIFAFQTAGRINRLQMFYFLDSLYRALPKILIPRGCTQPLPLCNVRLEPQEINKFLKILFDATEQIDRNDIYGVMMKVPELNQFIKYTHKKGFTSNENARLSVLSAGDRNKQMHISSSK